MKTGKRVFLEFLLKMLDYLKIWLTQILDESRKTFYRNKSSSKRLLVFWCFLFWPGGQSGKECLVSWSPPGPLSGSSAAEDWRKFGPSVSPLAALPQVSRSSQSPSSASVRHPGLARQQLARGEGTKLGKSGPQQRWKGRFSARNLCGKSAKAFSKKGELTQKISEFCAQEIWERHASLILLIIKFMKLKVKTQVTNVRRKIQAHVFTEFVRLILNPSPFNPKPMSLTIELLENSWQGTRNCNILLQRNVPSLVFHKFIGAFWRYFLIWLLNIFLKSIIV